MSMWRGLGGNREVPPFAILGGAERNLEKEGGPRGRHGFPRGSEPEASDAHGAPPRLACFSCASICLSRFWSPACRSLTWPACHLRAKFWISVWYAAPASVIGVVLDFGLAMILRNGAKCGSGLISGDLSELLVEGTFRMAFENCARK